MQYPEVCYEVGNRLWHSLELHQSKWQLQTTVMASVNTQWQLYILKLWLSAVAVATVAAIATAMAAVTTAVATAGTSLEAA